MARGTHWIIRTAKEIGGILKDVWTDFESSCPCCGIRLDRRKFKEEPAVAELPTASSCCGVRF